MKILKFENKVYSWIFPDVKGIPPVCRFKHAAAFYEPLALLIIHGGRNDNLYESAGSFCLADIQILNIEFMQWSNVIMQGYNADTPRCSHSAAIFGNNLLIFGGLNINEYANSALRYIELSINVRSIRLFNFWY